MSGASGFEDILVPMKPAMFGFRCALGGAMVIAGTVLGNASGCVFPADYEDCYVYPHVGCFDAGAGAGGSSSSSSSSSTTGGTGGTGGNPACAGDPTTDPALVRDECGVFAQADATTGGDGSMANPLATLGDAIAKARSAGKRVYACAGAPFVEAVTISAGIEMYGGFDCTKGWAWSQDARAVLNGPPDAIAVTLEKNAGGARVDGFAITAASPSDMKGGGSSIAIAADDVTATIERCDARAGDAADGADGKTPADPVTKGAGAPAADPLTMNACINPGSVAGGPPGVTTCDDGDTSGGNGGKGGITGTNNGDGEKGADGSPIDPVDGLGGAGEAATKCDPGGVGKDGDAGAPGPGGSAMGDALSLSGIVNSDPTDGAPGTKAQGGGGGGGAKAGMFCGGGADGNGASGGGGGAGGCGGKGGGGGKAGGSSVAILALGTNLTFVEVTIGLGNAGKGGAGATGQPGGDPGHGVDGGAKSGIVPSINGCTGGDGGTGGPGGSAGGGRGGHAIGILFAKPPTTVPVIKSFTPGTPGDGGAAGVGAPVTSNGALGNAGQCWDFMSNAACK